MKKTLAILLLCLGFSIGASAQEAEADNYAEKITIALNDMTTSKITLDDYVKICESIGIDMGEYITTLEVEEIEPFLEQFFRCIYYHFAKYGIPRDQADMVVESFKSAFYGAINNESQNRTTESVAAKADEFAKEMANIMEDALNGKQDQAATEKVGFDLGAYIGKITPEEIKVFQTEFYKALTVHISRIPALAEFTTAEINEIIELIRAQYDPIFGAFL